MFVCFFKIRLFLFLFSASRSLATSRKVTPEPRQRTVELCCLWPDSCCCRETRRCFTSAYIPPFILVTQSLLEGEEHLSGNNFTRSRMEATKGDSAEQAATLFGTQEMESQRRNAVRGKKWSKRCKVITGVRSDALKPTCLFKPETWSHGGGELISVCTDVTLWTTRWGQLGSVWTNVAVKLNMFEVQTFEYMPLHALGSTDDQLFYKVEFLELNNLMVNH